MNTMRKIGLIVATAMLSLGFVGMSAPAHAYDTTWSCPTCVRAGR
jgi:hypothetical protein